MGDDDARRPAWGPSPALAPAIPERKRKLPVLAGVVPTPAEWDANFRDGLRRRRREWSGVVGDGEGPGYRPELIPQALPIAGSTPPATGPSGEGDLQTDPTRTSDLIARRSSMAA